MHVPGFLSRILMVTPLAVFVGCFPIHLDELAKEPPEKQTYLFSVEVPTAKPSPIAQNPVLLVEQASAPSPYNGRPFVYRTDENAFTTDYFHGFLISPAEQLSQLTRAWLRSSAVFAQVVDADSSLVPDAVLELNLVELRADYRVAAAPVARIRVRVAFLSFGIDEDGRRDPGRREVRFQRTYDESASLPSATPEALMAGWDQAITKLLRKLTDDLRPLGIAGE